MILSHRMVLGPAMVDHSLVVGLASPVLAAQYVLSKAVCERGLEIPI